MATLVHAAALAVPSINASLYSPAYPWWRHIVFISVNGTLAWLLPRPPSWLVWPYAVLTLQVLYSHGLGGWRYGTETGRINWLDPVSVIGVPAVLILLFIARTRPKHATEKPRSHEGNEGARKRPIRFCVLRTLRTLRTLRDFVVP